MPDLEKETLKDEAIVVVREGDIVVAVKEDGIPPEDLGSFETGKEFESGEERKKVKRAVIPGKELEFDPETSSTDRLVNLAIDD